MRFGVTTLSGLQGLFWFSISVVGEDSERASSFLQPRAGMGQGRVMTWGFGHCETSPYDEKLILLMVALEEEHARNMPFPVHLE